MLRIITDAGKELDVRPDTSVEFEMENPIFCQDYIPNTFSTSLQFPPTMDNCIVFGYLPALKMLPSVRSLAVSLVLDGVELMSGTLEFDAVTEDGFLEYGFSGNRLASLRRNKIYNATSASGDWIKTILPSRVAETGDEKILDNVMTAVSVNDILSTVPFLVMEAFPIIHILGQGVFPVTRTYTSPAAQLPDVSFLELLQAVAKTFCMAVFRDGNRLYLKRIYDILISPVTDSLDWESKVSDVFEARKMIAKGYRFGFGSEEGSAGSEATAAANQGETTVAYMGTMFSAATNDYKAFKVTNEGDDIFSIKKENCTVDGISTYERLVDTVHREGLAVVSVGTGSEDEIVDNSSPFIPIRCVPCEILSKSGSSITRTPKMLPAIEPVYAVSLTDHPTKMYIGTLHNSQLVDNKTYGYGSGWQYGAYPIRSQRIFDDLHATFARFINTDKDTITAGLNLSVSDIAAFRFWQKVQFSGRLWLVKKLIFVITAKRGLVSSRGEFVECP